MNPFFTVIIPTYNREKLITGTLERVLAQSFDSFEVIVVDNFSTDNTMEALQSYAKRENVSVIQHDRNYERSKSRNTGMIHARGEYVTFLDSDDVMYPDNLRDAHDFAVANPDIHIFHNRYKFVNEALEEVKGPEVYEDVDILRNIARGNFLACIGTFISKEIYIRYRFDENPVAVGSEDWDFWLRILADFPEVGKIPKVNSALLQHSQRSMHNIDLNKIIKTKAYIINKVKNDVRLAGVYRTYLSFMEASSYLFISSTANTLRKKGVALKYFLKALKANPKVLFSCRALIILKNLIF